MSNEGNGIWTNNDWTDNAKDVKVTNGMIEGISEEQQRRIEAGQNLIGEVPDYDSKENVVRAKAILTEEIWAEKFPNALDVYTYEAFFQALAKYPKFCGEALDSSTEENLLTACKLELATLLAHIKNESNSL